MAALYSVKTCDWIASALSLIRVMDSNGFNRCRRRELDEFVRALESRL